MNTTKIAHLTGLTVAEVNGAARDLDLLRYDFANRCRVVDDECAGAFIDHLMGE